ncbi:DNA primase family protein [Rhodopirellula halodulae]|uniref:DNA primase family protein n=1 Tax=Rhodopirellula halodulae TaxID=2894198 RepID=UPI001E5C3F62|nr:phage/plasmid primase, P4 family [Rhodopirellula sp. JC737]MCC9655612.1 phage/plasmid primase, P4 family [Rhodopirellula sp. JC737]
MSDLPRILRLPGFLNQKAEPYRQCEIITTGSDELLPIETMEAFLDEHGSELETVSPDSADSGEPNYPLARNVKAWTASHGYPGTIDTFRDGLVVNLPRCPLNHANHSSDSTVPGITVRENKLGFNCFGDQCANKHFRDLETAWGQSFAEFMGDTPPQVRGIAQAVDDPNRIATEWKQSLTVDYVPGIVIVDDELWFREGEKWTQPTPAKLSSMATARCQKEFNDDFLRRQSEAATVASIGDGKSVDSIRATPAAVKPAKKTSKSLSANVIDSLRSIVPELPRNGQQMIGHSTNSADDIRRLANVDLNVRKYIDGDRDAVTPHSPQLFTRSIIDCEWDPEATAPVWEAFLASLKLTDDEMRFLRQAIAYVAFPIESLEKYFMHVGPTRCGKKVVFEILMMLCGGTDAVVSIDFRDFASDFGLQETPGKRLVLVPEATMSDKNLAKAVQRIKAWTGGDAIPINRKNKAPLSEKLDAVIWMSSNERLALRDDSSALQARQLLIQFRESFFGREDIQLSKKLRNELPGILLWALEGLKDLKENDWRFAIPDSWKEAAEDLARDSMPVRSFIADCFDPAPGERTPINQVKNLYTDWSDQEISDAKLIRELKAAPFKVTRPWEKDEHGRRPTYLNDYLPSTGA